MLKINNKHLKTEGQMKRFITIISILTFIFSTYSQIPNRGLVCYFPFEGDKKDYCNNLTKVLPVKARDTLVSDTNRFNKPNGAIRSGIPSDKSLIFEDTSNKLPFLTKEFTICFWAMRMANPTGALTQYIIVYGDTSNLLVDTLNKKGFKIYENSDGDICASYDNNKITIYNYMYTTYGKNWAFVAFTVKNDTIKGYFREYNNTKKETKESKGFSFTARTNTFSIGGHPKMREDGIIPQSSWCGRIDDICIYNRALTEQEIEIIYNATSSEINQSPSFTPYVVNTTAEVFKEFKYTIAVKNDDTYPITYKLSNDFIKISSIDNSSITITALPQLSDTGKKEIIITATDYLKDTSSVVVNITVTKPTKAPIIISKADTVAYVDKEYIYEIKLADSTEKITVSITEGIPFIPTGIKIEDKIIKWTPTAFQANKTFEFTITVKNIYENSATQKIRITVKDNPTSIIQVNSLKTEKTKEKSVIYLINGKKISGSIISHSLTIDRINNCKLLNIKKNKLSK